MPWLRTDEIWQGRVGSLDDSGRRQYERIFQVYMTSTWDDQIAAMGAPFIPARYSPYTDQYGNLLDIGALAIAITARQDQADPLKWTVTVKYDSQYVDALLGDKNPLNRRTVKSFDAEKYQEAYQQDSNKLDVLNSAGDPFDPPLMRDAGRGVFTVVRNEPIDPLTRIWANAVFIDLFQDTVNVNPFFIWAALAVKCDSITYVEEQETTIGIYARVTYKFHIRSEGWMAKPQDAGFRKAVTFPTIGKFQTAILDPHGHPVSQPALLDGNGNPLAIGAAPVYLKFQPYDTADFDQMGLT